MEISPWVPKATLSPSLPDCGADACGICLGRVIVQRANILRPEHADFRRTVAYKVVAEICHDYVTCLDPKIDTFRFSEAFLSIRPKVVYRQTSGSIIAAIDLDGRYLDKTVHMIVPKEGWALCAISEKVLLGLLNSRLFDYLYRYVSQESEGRAFAQVKTTYIKKLMVPCHGSKRTEEIHRLVDEILVASSEDKRRSLEGRLDDAVYALYDLSPAEIALVTGAEDSEAELLGCSTV